MYDLGEEVEIVVTRYGVEPNFDRACEAAMERAIYKFEIDENGHINGVEGAERSAHGVHIEFVKNIIQMGMSGANHIYIFKAKVE